MTPARVLLLSIALGIVSTLLPVVLAIYLSWATARNEETVRLRGLAGQVIERTLLVFREATDTLTAIDAAGLTPCSPEHIAEMRRLAINAPSVEEIGYTENGVLRCTSWGVTEIVVRQTPFDFETQNGIAVVASLSPAVSGGQPVMALRLDAYNALVSPTRIVDVLADQTLRVAVAHAGGTVIALRDQDSRGLVGALFQDGVGSRDPGLIVVTEQQGEWRVALATPTTMARAIFVRQLALFVPIGAVVGALAAGAVFWLSRKRLSPAGELALAVRRREFVVHYQPIINLRSGECIGAEALVRWKMPDGSFVSPDMFIPLAEETGLIRPITDQVVAGVISDLQFLLEKDRSIHVAINFAAVDIQTGRIPELLRNALAGTRIDPSQIWLEATERGFMDIEPARETMSRARSLGHIVVIDDFGTGFSSLQYLSHLPLDALKIDKAFIDTIGKEAVTSSVTLYIIEMAKALDLFIVAEGVERQEQVDYLVEHGVEYAQGWLFSRPLPAEEFLVFLRRQKRSISARPAPASNHTSSKYN